MNRHDAMTVEEALRIRSNARHGLLDSDLPGTLDVVRAAERIGDRADLWGATRHDRTQSIIGALLIAAGTVAVTAVALLPDLVPR